MLWNYTSSFGVKLLMNGMDLLHCYILVLINCLQLLEGCRTLAVGTKAIINLGLEKVPSQEEAGIHFRLQLLVFSIIVEELFEADKGGNKANGFPNNNYHVVLPFFKCSYYCIDNGIIKFFMQLSCTSLFMDQIHYFGFSRVDKNYATDLKSKNRYRFNVSLVKRFTSCIRWFKLVLDLSSFCVDCYNAGTIIQFQVIKFKPSFVIYLRQL
ncbi:hypothetical protein ACJX0J_025302, partial [Zea mays]